MNDKLVNAQELITEAHSATPTATNMASKGKGRKRNNDNKRKTEAAAAGMPSLSNDEPIDAQELTTEADPASPSSKKSKKKQKRNNKDKRKMEAATAGVTPSLNVEPPAADPTTPEATEADPATPNATEADPSIAESADPASSTATYMASPKSISKGKGRKRNNDNKRGTEAATTGMPPLSNDELVEKSQKKQKRNNEDKRKMEAATAGVTLSLDVEPPAADPTTSDKTEADPATPKATKADPSITEATEADPSIPKATEADPAILDATEADPATPAAPTPSVRPSTNMDPVDAQGMEEQPKEGANAGALNDDTVITQEKTTDPATPNIEAIVAQEITNQDDEEVLESDKAKVHNQRGEWLHLDGMQLDNIWRLDLIIVRY